MARKGSCKQHRWRDTDCLADRRSRVDGFHRLCGPSLLCLGPKTEKFVIDFDRSHPDPCFCPLLKLLIYPYKQSYTGRLRATFVYSRQPVLGTDQIFAKRGQIESRHLGTL